MNKENFPVIPDCELPTDTPIMETYLKDGDKLRTWRELANPERVVSFFRGQARNIAKNESNPKSRQNYLDYADRIKAGYRFIFPVSKNISTPIFDFELAETNDQDIAEIQQTMLIMYFGIMIRTFSKEYSTGNVPTVES